MNESMNKKNTVTILFCALIVIAVCFRVFTFRFGVLDEIWPYDLSRAITMGYIPYKDYPIVSMPLFSFIFAVPLLISRSLLAYRVMTALFFSAMLIVFYMLIKGRTASGYALCSALFAARFVELATYNMLMMFEALLIICCLRIKRSKTRAFLIGFLVALAPLTKQSSGSVLMLLITGLTVYFAVKEDEKKSLIPYFTGMCIPLVSFLVYLLCTSSFADFWDCCFFGLFSFAGENSAIHLEGTIPIMLIVVAGIAGDLYFWIKKHDKESLYHLLAGAAILTNAIPIFEYYHIIMGGIFFIIPVAYLVREFAPRYIHFNMTPIIAPMILVIIGVLSYTVLSDLRLSDKWTELKCVPSVGEYDYLEPVIGKKRALENEGKDVVVFSASSAVIAILDESCDPPFDMFLNGNLGTTEPLDYVQDVCSKNNTVILITSLYNEENWQNPDGVYEYVTSHCTCVETDGEWEWYVPNEIFDN